MHVDGEVAVDVRQRQAGGDELVELRDDLAPELRAYAGGEEVAHPGADRVHRRSSRRRRRAAGCRAGGADALPCTSIRCRPTLERRVGARELDRFGEGLPFTIRLAVGEDAVAVRADDARR